MMYRNVIFSSSKEGKGGVSIGFPTETRVQNVPDTLDDIYKLTGSVSLDKRYLKFLFNIHFLNCSKIFISTLVVYKYLKSK